MIVIVFHVKRIKPRSEEMPFQNKKPSEKLFLSKVKNAIGYRPENLKFQDVFQLKHISFLLVLYFLIFLGFNIYYTSFPTHAVQV